MIISTSWLADYVQVPGTVDELVERLAMSGLNHESTTAVGDDTAIELEVTSNRPDCLGHIGVAREAAVLFDRPLAVPDPRPLEGVEEAASDTAGVATGSIASPTTATTGNEPVPEPLPAEEPAGSEGWMPLPVLPPTPRGTFAEIGKTVRPTGEGTLEVVVTTVREKTPRQVSIMPDRIELWTQDRLLATLEDGEPGVENAFHRRTFSFQPLTLPAGYYYLTIRGFAEGFVTRERKWKGKTVQIGIHDGKTTKLREALSMFVW